MQIDVDLTAAESDLLAQVVSLLRKTENDLTHARLEVGRACCDLIASRAARGFSARGTRILLTDHLKRQLGQRTPVSKLISVYQTVLLLGDGDPGDLRWSALFFFYPLVGQSKESWSIQAGYESTARTLFNDARRFGWSQAKVAAGVGELVGRHLSASGNRKPDGSHVDDHSFQSAQSDPRDVADHLAHLVNNHPDPKRVVRELLKHDDIAALLAALMPLVAG